jgi:phosphate transport system substrate-binding protein
MKYKIFIIFLIVIVFSVVVSSCHHITKSDNYIKQYYFDGSTTLFPIVKSYYDSFHYYIDSNDFSYLNSTFDFIINESGSSIGISKLINGDIDVAMSSREITYDEYNLAKSRGVDLYIIPIAYDIITIIVNSDINFSHITEKDVYDIFVTGKIKNWNYFLNDTYCDIIPVGSNYNKSGTSKVFFDHLINYHNFGKQLKINSDYVELNKSDEIVNYVLKNNCSIGFSSYHYLLDSVNVLNIDEYEANRDNIVNSKYHFVRKLFLITDGQPDGYLREFVLFLLKHDNQKELYDLNYYPIIE